MRISKLLIESVASDVFSGDFENFLSDYNVIYSSRLFVAFTNNEDFSRGDLEKDTSTGMRFVYPLQDVVENPAKYIDYAETAYLHVIKLKTVFDINQVKLRHVNDLSKVCGISKDDFERLVRYFTENYKAQSPSMESYMFSKILFNDIKVSGDDVSFEKSGTHSIKRRLRKLGISTILQSDDDGYMLSKNKSVIAYPTQTGTVMDTYSITDDSNESEPIDNITSDNDLYFRDHRYMRTVAGKIAEGLGTKLNSDPVYSLFLDYYYWTTDGIELVITVAFSDSEITSTHDNVYYVVEANTPYGIMVTRIEADSNLDNIAEEIRDTYAYHVTPNESWEPQNRDLFLDDERKEYKLFDAHYDDVVKVVNEYYPSMHRLGRTYRIAMPVLSYYGSFDKVYIHQFMEFLASNPTSANKLMKELEDKNYNFNDLFYVPMPRKITVDILKSIAMIYSEMKKRKPSAKGWYLFKDK